MVLIKFLCVSIPVFFLCDFSDTFYCDSYGLVGVIPSLFFNHKQVCPLSYFCPTAPLTLHTNTHTLQKEKFCSCSKSKINLPLGLETFGVSRKLKWILSVSQKSWIVNSLTSVPSATNVWAPSHTSIASFRLVGLLS